MSTALEILFAPAEFGASSRRDLSRATCVVFDVLRATSTMVTALANGAAAIIPVAEISEALDLRTRSPDLLLAGEREGLRIGADLTGGTEFDLGNSPREFTPADVSGRTVVMTTTNGTRALRACSASRSVLIGSFLNLKATARLLLRSRPADLLLVCAGTEDQIAYEDVLAAGALCDLVWPAYGAGWVADSVGMARRLFAFEKNDLPTALAVSRNGRRLMAQPQLREDVAFCAQRDIFDFTPMLDREGHVRIHEEPA